jgi:hypothetical protein
MKTGNYPGRIKCNSCGNYHYDWWIISQKYGCASHITYNSEQNYYQINSYYGSGYDNDIFKIVNPIVLQQKLPT